MIFGIGCNSKGEKEKVEYHASPLTDTKRSNLPLGEMVLIPEGYYEMGSNNEQADPDEFPKHGVSMKSFWMDAHKVTNSQFMEFVQQTGYIKKTVL